MQANNIFQFLKMSKQLNAVFAILLYRGIHLPERPTIILFWP